MGPDAERIDLDPSTLRDDSARLADEAASFSMFGDKRWIRVNGMGEESLPALTALLEAEAAGNPVLAVEIGRESCRESVGQYVECSVVAHALKKKIKKIDKEHKRK